jgi:hypothetical protein
MPRTKKQSTEAAVREIRRRTRRKFAPEEKIRIVLEGLRGWRAAIRSLRLYTPKTYWLEDTSGPVACAALKT